MSVHNQPGRGRKYCKGCGKYVGVRSKVCINCNFSFSAPTVAKGFNPIIPTKPKIEGDVETAIEDESSEEDVDSSDVEQVEVVKTIKYNGTSHVDRVNRLRDELIRELKQLSFGYSMGILDEIKDAIKKY
jgi:hypothetical protein